MTEPEGSPDGDTRNEVSTAADNIVQARDIHGGVHFHQLTRLAWPAPRQLPPDIAHFKGRDVELARLDALLRVPAPGQGQMMVISAIAGAGGIGKTSLAIRWAYRVRDRFPDGQLYINLRGYDPGRPVSAGQALDGFLRALDVPGERIPRELDERVALYRSLMAGRRMLVVLDNAATTEQVWSLLPGSPSCLVVVTSRSRLSGLIARAGAQRIILDVLPQGEAVALLRQVIGPERSDAEPAAISELARSCG